MSDPADALRRLTDDTGMLQHSRFGVPDRAHGYCIDDNARALMLMAIATDLPGPLRSRWAHVYAAFVQDAWNEETRRFRNFMAFDRSWLERVGSSDSNGRTLWALAVTQRQCPDVGLAEWAATLFDETIGCVAPVQSPRTAAFVVLALLEVLPCRTDGDHLHFLLRQNAKLLLDLFERQSAADWPWFEPYLSYDNYRLSEAMLRAGRALESDAMIDTGRASLVWLVDRQTSLDGVFRPVGTAEFGVVHSEPRRYDQQPLEAWAAIDAAIAAERIVPGARWVEHGEAAFAWFEGRNDASERVADADTGECFDGVTATGVNRNRGAESVLAWHFAQRRISTLRTLDVC